MTDVSQISEFGKILIFIITGIIMVCVIFFINRLLAPNNPNAEKLSSYECGEEPTGNAWLPFNPRFYVIALVFLLFDVEMVFIFPWATVFGSHEIAAQDARWGWLSLAEMFVFLGILIVGLIYVWRKGDLDWIKPKPIVPHTDVHIPPSLYEQLNQEQSRFTVKDFNIDTVITTTAATAAATATPSTEPARKPMFKPAFKKPANE
ncbi:NADH-quinone oxidoreductase subunit A [Mucilaginibacter sp. Mucisp86]|uniref:NADH-quinone oxidoreductase subunit A n=1 Tax=Mucilaginibacter sp. Mucisp86 TaxID=3243060 RepID=UPI0039B3DEDF